MSQKQLILFGTRHWKTSDIPAEIQTSMERLIEVYRPDVALEEWFTTQTEESGLAGICKSRDLLWESIGTPSEREFETYGRADAADFPDSTNVTQYGPLGAQERREHAMCENVVRAMAFRSVALVVLGLAHLHSMMSKLSKSFEVRAYAYCLEVY